MLFILGYHFFGVVCFVLEEGVLLIWSRGSYFTGGGVCLNLEEGVILCLGGGVHFDLATERNNVGVAHFAHA